MRKAQMQVELDNRAASIANLEKTLDRTYTRIRELEHQLATAQGKDENA